MDINAQITSQIKDYLNLFDKSSKTIMELEDIAATSAINFKYANNIRNSLAHLTIAVSALFETPPDHNKNVKNFNDAIHDVENLSVDASELLAGEYLGEAKETISRRGILKKSLAVDKIIEQALNQYTKGRTIRTDNVEQANECFKNCINLCFKALSSVELVPKGKIITWIIALIAALGALCGWFLFLGQLYGWF
jgi:hypothetical protein